MEDAHEQIDHAIATAVREQKPCYINICCNLAGVAHPSFASTPVPFSITPRHTNQVRRCQSRRGRADAEKHRQPVLHSRRHGGALVIDSQMDMRCRYYTLVRVTLVSHASDAIGAIMHARRQSSAWRACLLQLCCPRCRAGPHAILLVPESKV